MWEGKVGGGYGERAWGSGDGGTDLKGENG